MPTEITQLDDTVEKITTLRIRGEMQIDDARLLQRIAESIRVETGHRVLIDLAELDLLDSESAPLIRNLGQADGIEILGIEIFLQAMIDQVERFDATADH